MTSGCSCNQLPLIVWRSPVQVRYLQLVTARPRPLPAPPATHTSAWLVLWRHFIRASPGPRDVALQCIKSLSYWGSPLILAPCNLLVLCLQPQHMLATIPHVSTNRLAHLTASNLFAMGRPVHSWLMVFYLCFALNCYFYHGLTFFPRWYDKCD